MIGSYKILKVIVVVNTIPASSVIPKKVIANARVDIGNGVLYEDN